MLPRFVLLILAGLVACAEGAQSPTGGGDGGESATGGTSTSSGAAGVGGGDGGAPPETCGNGQVDAGEDCDGGFLDGKACTDVGFVGGELACDPSCAFDTSACLDTLCGNGAIDMGEACDGADLGGATCSSEMFAGGTLACDATTCLLDTSGCNDPLNEGFEGGAIPAGFTSGPASWSGDGTVVHTGSFAAKSGLISDNGTTSLSATVQFDAAGTISFWHYESTETCCDYLQFYIDGAMQTQWTTASWQQASFPVSAGAHTLEWRYAKDYSISSGSDAVWVDDIVATGGYLP